MIKFVEQVQMLLADPAALEAAKDKEYKYYEPEERAAFDKYDLIARLFLRNEGIESSSSDWEESVRRDLAAVLRLVGAR